MTWVDTKRRNWRRNVSDGLFGIDGSTSNTWRGEVARMPKPPKLKLGRGQRRNRRRRMAADRYGWWLEVLAAAMDWVKS
jgi:hypothetical protein